MINGIRCRAYPSAEQQVKLAQWIGCARVIYNAKVDEMEYFQTFARKALGPWPRLEMDQAYSQFKSKELTPFLFDVPSQVLRNASTQFMTAWQRHLKGLASRPARKKKGRRDSVCLTSELFTLDADGLVTIGTRKHALGTFKVSLHRPVNKPNSIVVSRRAGRWYVSFNFEDPSLKPPPERQDVLADLSHLSEAQLTALTWAGDRGVTEMLHGSDGKVFHLADEGILKARRRERRKKQLQKKMARQQKGSNRRRKTKARIAKVFEQQAMVRHNFAHQVSHLLVRKTEFKVFTFEDLKIANMTKRAKPKQDEETGQYLPNGAASKSGLNRSILQSCWGNITLFTHYKAERMGKVAIKVAPHHSSQTCSKCGHTSSANRHKKWFACTRCGFTSDADFNAALVLRNRGVRHVIDLGWKSRKAKKKVSFRKKGLGTRPLNHVESAVAQAISSQRSVDTPPAIY